MSEFISNPDFPDLLAALELFIDRKISDNMKIINASYKTVIDTINKQNVKVGRDEYIAMLQEPQEAVIDPDDYLRFRLSKKFDILAQRLYNANKKDTVINADKGFLSIIKEQLQTYRKVKDETGSAEQAKLALLADRMGVNIAKTTETEKQTMLSFLSRSLRAKKTRSCGRRNEKPQEENRL